MNLMTDSWFLKQIVLAAISDLAEQEMQIFDEVEHKKMMAEMIEKYHDEIVKKMETVGVDCPIGLEDSVNIAVEQYGLKLGESIELNNFTSVERVPGGWVYSSGIKEPYFVPYSDEFESLKYYRVKADNDERVIPSVENPQ